MRQEGHLMHATYQYFVALVAVSVLAILILLSLAKERNTSLRTLSEAETILLKEEQFLERVFSVISSKDDSRRRREEEVHSEWLQLKDFLQTFEKAPSLQRPRGK